MVEVSEQTADGDRGQPTLKQFYPSRKASQSVRKPANAKVSCASQNVATSDRPTSAQADNNNATPETVTEPISRRQMLFSRLEKAKDSVEGPWTLHERNVRQSERLSQGRIVSRTLATVQFLNHAWPPHQEIQEGLEKQLLQSRDSAVNCVSEASLAFSKKIFESAKQNISPQQDNTCQEQSKQPGADSSSKNRSQPALRGIDILSNVCSHHSSVEHTARRSGGLGELFGGTKHQREEGGETRGATKRQRERASVGGFAQVGAEGREVRGLRSRILPPGRFELVPRDACVTLPFDVLKPSSPEVTIRTLNEAILALGPPPRRPETIPTAGPMELDASPPGTPRSGPPPPHVGGLEAEQVLLCYEDMDRDFNSDMYLSPTPTTHKIRSIFGSPFQASDSQGQRVTEATLFGSVSPWAGVMRSSPRLD